MNCCFNEKKEGMFKCNLNKKRVKWVSKQWCMIKWFAIVYCYNKGVSVSPKIHENHVGRPTCTVNVYRTVTNVQINCS